MDKSTLRSELRQLRATPRPLADATLSSHCANFIAELGVERPRVAAYVPLDGEPGGQALLPALRATGAELYLPVALPGDTLKWALDTGYLKPGYQGISEPDSQRLPSSLLETCDLVLVPSLGVGPQGHRLGQGGGFYDRTWAAIPTPPRAVAVVYSNEYPVDFSAEPHDMQVSGVITDEGVTLLEP
ncbi:5-formyltetrahydrofolate cyclo-ligase [Corynebacterium renale]|uniref:5-formyltetrahydrofolate cyclo-ligase n=1 Tax=Corynebacterium renale TaxID=1724 RepID=UPI000DFD7D8A|nr:5-formyltetrahydrofolate cyclo-ligase [Corynebacterium renale]STC94829.1 5-formyltetrahydrofolate cyclo-ligase [Corynebacterium renale]